MTADKLMLYFNLFLAAIVVLGALKGLIQGFKKSLFVLIKKLIFWAGFFLTADLFANYILSSVDVFEQIMQYIPVEGNPTNVVELVQCILIEYLGVSEGTTLTSSINYLLALLSIGLKLAYLVLYHTVIKFIYWIFCGIIWKLFINRKHIEVEYSEKIRRNGKVKRIKKKVDLRKDADGPRIFGLIFGAGRAMITVTLLISFITSMISLLPDNLLNKFDEESNVTASTQLELSQENMDSIEIALEGYEEFIKFIGDIENSPFVKLVQSIESNDSSLDLVLFDTIMNGNYEEYNIRTRESLSTMINIGYDVALILDACQLEDGQLDFNQIDFDELADLVEKITDIDLLMDAIPAVIEIGLSIEELQTQLPIPVDDELKQAMGSIEWENDIVVLANVVRTLSDLDNVNEVIGDPLVLLSKENEQVITEIITQLADLTFVTKMLPTAVDYALTLDEVKELIGETTIDLSNIVWEEELVHVANIYSEFLTLSSDIVKLLFVDEISVENIIDGVNLNALNDLILKVFELGIMEQLFEPIMDIVVSEIEDPAIREMLNFDFDNYEDWAKEFTIVIDIVKELVANENPFKYGVDINIIKNINPETIVKSRILSEVLISALIDASNGEGIFTGEEAEQLSAFIDVPSYLHDKNNESWYNKYDENGVLISKGQLHLTLEGLQAILPKNKETELNVGDNKALSYKLSGVETAEVMWSSSNISVASVNEEGVVTAISQGHTIIFVTTSNGKVKDMIDIVVKGDAAVPVEYVLIEGEEVYELTIDLENPYSLTANTNLDATNQVLVWESADETIVKVNQEGVVEGLQLGNTTIKVTSNADSTKYAICNVTVVEKLPDIIDVNKDSLVGHPKKTFYVDASINNEKEGLSYVIADSSIASVDEEGFVTLLSEGETTLTISNSDGTITKLIEIIVVSYTSPTGIKIISGSDGLDVSGILSSLDKSDIETIIGSDVLTRSLSKILLDALEVEGENPGTSIHFPTSVIETDGETKYIEKAEVETILNILLEVDISAIFEGGDISNLLNELDDDSIDKILESKVLNAFLSSTISTVGDGAIVIPSTAYEAEVDYCYKHPSTEIKYIKSSEIKSLVKMLRDYDLLSGDLSIELKEDNSDLIDLIEDSDILRATLSKFILDMSEGADSVIIVPDQAIEVKGGCNLLEVIEFEAVLDALYDLGFEEISSSSLSFELTVGQLKGSLTSINNSKILLATISDKIIPVEGIIVPDQALHTSYSVNGENISVLKTTEIENLVNALAVILGESSSITNINLDLTTGSLQDAITYINNSSILKTTIADKIIPLTSIIVPDEVVEDNIYSKGTTYYPVLKDAELKGLVDALVILLDESTNINNLDLDLKVKQLKESMNSINASGILRATISDKIVNNSSMSVPTDAYDVEIYHHNGSEIKLLSKTELQALTKALENILGAETSLNNFNVPMDIFNSLLSASDNPNKNKLEQSLESVIIWDKVSTMISDSAGSLIVVPNSAKEGNLATGRITVEEINDLMKALEVLGVGSIDTISLNANFIFDLDDEVKDTLGNTELTKTTIALEKSKILMASIPSLFEEGIASAYEEDISISFESVTLEGTLNVNETAYVSEGELVRLFRAARAANILKSKELGDLSGKISNPNSRVSEINSLFLVLYASEVLRPTVKQVLVSLTSGIGLDLNGVELTEETIPVILSKAAAINDLQAYAQLKAQGQNSVIQAQITYTSAQAVNNIYGATTVTSVETLYDDAINNIDAFVA